MSNCPHCNSTADTWFDRSYAVDSNGSPLEYEEYATRCSDCGKNVDAPKEYYEIQTYTPEMISVDKSVLYDTISALQAGLENTQEILIEHDASLGRTTRKNKWIAEQMETDIRNITKCLENLKALFNYDKKL